MLLTTDQNNTYLSPENNLSGLKFFAIPSGGVNFQYDSKTTFGVVVYGEGAGGIYNQSAVPVPGFSHLTTIFSANFIAPTVTRKLTDNLAVGVSLNLVSAAFLARGVAVPNGQPINSDLSSGLSQLPGHGMRFAFGAGFKLGVLWDVLPTLSVGASYTSKTALSRFSGYNRDIFASSDGRLDLPEEYGVGLSWRPIPALTLAADYLRINWGNTRVFGDPGSFGYRNINVGRFGAAYDINNRWTVRAGYMVSGPWSDSAHTMAVLGPVTQNRSVTAGFTYHIDKKQDLSFSFDYGLPNKVYGTGPSTGTNLDTSINAYALQYSRKF
ncbi:OmpP1/FadL family transporter [Cupriavidus necator]